MSLRTKLQQLRPSSRPSALMMPTWYATQFAETLLFVLSALEHCDVRYVAHRGLLLGALRLQGLLPWDDDADLFVIDEDQASLERKLCGCLDAHGVRLEFRRREHYFWAYPRTIWQLPLAGLTELGLFTPSVEQGDGGRVFDAHEPRRRITEAELFPTVRLPFYGSHVEAPRASALAMDRMYGSLAAPAAFARFTRPAIDLATDAFWRRARPIDGPLDWESISARMSARNRSARFQLGQGPCSLYWLGNRGYWLAMDGVRTLAGG